MLRGARLVCRFTPILHFAESGWRRLDRVLPIWDNKKIMFVVSDRIRHRCNRVVCFATFVHANFTPGAWEKLRQGLVPGFFAPSRVGFATTEMTGRFDSQPLNRACNPIFKAKSVFNFFPGNGRKKREK